MAVAVTAPRLAVLDLLRFVAASSVLAYHYVSSYLLPLAPAEIWINGASTATRYGYLGVNLFFMISGYVILMSARGKSAIEFAIGRASRLFPSFWIAVLLASGLIAAFAMQIPGQQYVAVNPRILLANLTMVPGILGQPLIDTVYWTLELELRFYALVFLVLLCRQIGRAEAICFAWLGLILLGYLVELPWIVNFATLKPYGGFFLAGSFFYLLSTTPARPRLWLGVIACLPVCIVEALRQRSGFITPDAPSDWVVPVLILAMFLAFWARDRISLSAAAEALMTRLGALTYPLYLTHAIPGTMLIAVLVPVLGPAVTLVIAAVFALLLAQLMVVTVDVPARKPFANALRRLLPGTV